LQVTGILCGPLLHQRNWTGNHGNTARDGGKVMAMLEQAAGARPTPASPSCGGGQRARYAPDCWPTRDALMPR
jgi:hypothetical protein